MEIVNIFSTTLAELIGVEPSHCLALLRLSIRDSGKNPDQPLSQADFKQVFENQLRKRLVSIESKNADQVVATMLKSLDEKQSLFTLAS